MTDLYIHVYIDKTVDPGKKLWEYIMFDEPYRDALNRAFSVIPRSEFKTIREVVIKEENGIETEITVDRLYELIQESTVTDGN